MRIIGLVVSAVFATGLGIWWLGDAPETVEDVQEAVAPEISPAEICTANAATSPVLQVEKREIVIADGYKQLAVSPAKFGIVDTKLTLVPAHKEGATFFTEPTRVIVAEPTRRLTVEPAEFATAPAVDETETTQYLVENGALIEKPLALSPIPERRIVTKQASIMSVRFTPGFKQFDVKVIDKNGDGPDVPAEIITIERRTVEAHPQVTTVDVQPLKEMRDIQVVEKPAEILKSKAFCTIYAREDMILAVRSALINEGALSGAPDGDWDAATIDSMALYQEKKTGLISEALLLETLKILVPDIELPTS